MKQYGYLILTGIAIPLIGLIVYYFQAKVRLSEAKESLGLKADATPLEVLRSIITKKDDEMTEARAHLYQLVNSQMVRNDAGTKAITEMVDALRAQTQSLAEHKADSSARAAKIYEKVSEINERISVIETASRLKQ